MKKLVIVLVGLAAPLVLLGVKAEEQDTRGGSKNAVAVIRGFGDHKAEGVVYFTETGSGVEIKGKISGLRPGEHGFHIHEFGDISSADPKCHGGHFNPEKKKHGGPNVANRHVGDLGNISADGRGVAIIDMTDKQIALSGKHNIIGRAVILHAKADDLKSDPAGNAGDRIAGGVVGIAHPMADHSK